MPTGVFVLSASGFFRTNACWGEVSHVEYVSSLWKRHAHFSADYPATLSWEVVATACVFGFGSENRYFKLFAEEALNCYRPRVQIRQRHGVHSSTIFFSVVNCKLRDRICSRGISIFLKVSSFSVRIISPNLSYDLKSAFLCGKIGWAVLGLQMLWWYLTQRKELDRVHHLSFQIATLYKAAPCSFPSYLFATSLPQKHANAYVPWH